MYRGSRGSGFCLRRSPATRTSTVQEAGPRETAWAARRLWRRPRFAAVAVLTVAVAVAPSLIFRLVGRAVLPPLPFDRSDELVVVRQRAQAGWRPATSYPKFRYL